MTIAPLALPRPAGAGDLTTLRRRHHRPAAVQRPAGDPEVLTVLVLTVVGDVDDAWLADLAHGTAAASVQRLSPPDWSAGTPVRSAAADLLSAGDVTMDLGRAEVTAAGRRVDLTHQEFLLLKALLQHDGQVLSRPRLLELAWGRADAGSRRTVDVHVRRLRVKLGSAADRLVTVRGFGYRFDGGPVAGLEPAVG